MKKRTLSMALALCLICSLVIPVSAAESKPEATIDPSFDYLEDVNIAEAIATGNLHDISDDVEILSVNTTNEYDTIVKIKTQSKDSLLAKGISSQAIDAITNGQVEKELFARSQMTDSELTQMGYSAYEISILRNYDGSPLEKNPQLRAVSAEVIGTISKVASANYYATARFDFYWTAKPIVILASAKDYITCKWSGTSKNNIKCEMKYATGNCSITYSDGTKKTYPPAVKDSLLWVQSAVLQSTKNSATGNYLKSGSMSVQVQEHEIVRNLAATEFTFHYGHSTIVFSGGVTFSLTLQPNFSLGIGVVEEYLDHATVR